MPTTEYEIKGLQLVQYDTRTDVIRPIGDPYMGETLEMEIQAIKDSTMYGGGWEVVESVTGWGDATHLIRCRPDADCYFVYYLATLA